MPTPTGVTDLSYHIPAVARATKAHLCLSRPLVTALTGWLVIGHANKEARLLQLVLVF